MFVPFTAMMPRPSEFSTNEEYDAAMAEFRQRFERTLVLQMRVFGIGTAILAGMIISWLG